MPETCKDSLIWLRIVSPDRKEGPKSIHPERNKYLDVTIALGWAP
jgi:hypothetical protein